MYLDLQSNRKINRRDDNLIYFLTEINAYIVWYTAYSSRHQHTDAHIELGLFERTHERIIIHYTFEFRMRCFICPLRLLCSGNFAKSMRRIYCSICDNFFEQK